MAKKRNHDTRLEILECAEKIIKAEGANKFTLKEISEKLGVSKGTLFHHFKAKEEIVFEITVKHMDGLREEFLKWIGNEEKIISKEKFLDVVFFKGVKLFDRAKLHVFLVNECLSGSTELKSKFCELWKSWKSLLREGVERVFETLIDKEAFVQMIMIVLDGMIVQEVLQFEAVDTEKVSDYFLKKI